MSKGFKSAFRKGEYSVNISRNTCCTVVVIPADKLFVVFIFIFPYLVIIKGLLKFKYLKKIVIISQRKIMLDPFSML